MKNTEIVIVGGGLAGLSAAIHLASRGLSVTLFEKEKYPHHKVCGEYLSREILPYLESLNISLAELFPAEIDKLLYSTPSGRTVESKLDMGGLGISRYALDNFLYHKALENKVEVINEAVVDIELEKDEFIITSFQEKKFLTKMVLGAFGKRSGLDKKLKRNFISQKSGWLAVKAHYQMDKYPSDLVSLHNFRGGYCGLSKTETNAVNVCYLATYNSFKDHKNPEIYKNEVLRENPHLDIFFKDAVPLFENDLSIAQISFERKSLVENHILMLGDAAGVIHPLCGNGMAMAIHSAKLASESILQHYRSKGFDRINIEKAYMRKWDQHFSSRMKTGRVLQKILLNPTLAEASHNLVKKFPFILPAIVSKTHGNPVL